MLIFAPERRAEENAETKRQLTGQKKGTDFGTRMPRRGKHRNWKSANGTEEKIRVKKRVGLAINHLPDSTPKKPME
ncbi:hypothetical protein [Enterobacter sp. R4-368]|uniref:hypothetical protein n=1 Tax=Enterobacter sp. R4-368 TaxID=1166130 RepID=UPI00034F0575|nr:hypothetical protein [Enterobacter sp. R4-368]AGN85354.1 hypothetical protein H650_09325 [Enterobacter sp. R4-368]